MKNIFLDIDGVFNSKSSRLVHGGISSPYEVSYQLKKDTGLSVSDVMFNEVSVGLFGKVIQDFNANIIISSDWRVYMKESEIIEMFKVYGVDLTSKLKGMTPYLFDCKRGDEINKYLIDNKITSDYIIIDDINDDEFYEYQKTIIVDADDGLRYTDYLRLVDFLST